MLYDMPIMPYRDIYLSLYMHSQKTYRFHINYKYLCITRHHTHFNAVMGEYSINLREYICHFVSNYTNSGRWFYFGMFWVYFMDIAYISKNVIDFNVFANNFFWIWKLYRHLVLFVHWINIRIQLCFLVVAFEWFIATHFKRNSLQNMSFKAISFRVDWLHFFLSFLLHKYKVINFSHINTYQYTDCTIVSSPIKSTNPYVRFSVKYYVQSEFQSYKWWSSV